jgi:hypothetical protein
MPQNMGGVDRGIRVLLGIGLVSIVFIGPMTNWGWLGLIPLATAAFGYCPLYSVFGWSTKPAGPAKT